METLDGGSKLLWMLSTDFGRMVFVMLFITWGLIIVNLALSALLLINKVFGKQGIFKGKK